MNRDFQVKKFLEVPVIFYILFVFTRLAYFLRQTAVKQDWLFSEKHHSGQINNKFTKIGLLSIVDGLHVHVAAQLKNAVFRELKCKENYRSYFN